jgi:hypothetical protein
VSTRRESRERLERLAKALDTVEVDGSLQARVLEELVTGTKNVSELTHILYDVERGDRGFSSCYMRVRRATKRLENRGYIAASLLGRDKQYHLTRLGSQAIAGVFSERPVVEMRSVRALIIALTLLTGLINLFSGGMPPFWRVQISSIFLVLLGMSIIIVASWLSEVW